MTNETNPPPKPRYVWPWFVLAGFLLGLAAAIVWMSAEVRRMKQRRDFTYPATVTNSTSSRPAPR